MNRCTLKGARLLLPSGLSAPASLTMAEGKITAIGDEAASGGEGGSSAAGEDIDLGGGYLLPGFIDIQVNGGGGVLFNDAPDLAGISAIAEAHRPFGTTGLLPTLISDDSAQIARAIAASEAAIEAGIPGILGVHIEGPFIADARRGIHDARHIRVIDDEAIALLSQPGRGVRMVTLAPECAPPGTIARLRAAGVIVCAGHSAASYDETRAALAEGLSGFTHLFNAMTQFLSRAPGMVGAALEDKESRFGIIVDGHHVHPASLKVALAARGVEGAMLVTDAMPQAGTSMESFSLQGQMINVDKSNEVPALRGEDGTLAGAALTMDMALRNTMTMLGQSLASASQMASANPAAFLGEAARRGAIAPGLAADLVHLDDDFHPQSVWIAGHNYKAK